MQNLWSDGDAKTAIAHHAAKGIGEDLALRVYTTRLLGGEPRLVLHGGGNTSVKTKVADITGAPVEVLCVKGSGWDMGTIEAPDLMPGFALAKKANEVSRANPDVEGLILLKHGIFSMGATAEEAYVRMIDLVTLAEQRLAKATRKIFTGAALPEKIATAADVAPILRGLLSLPAKAGGREAAQ